ncbi:guanylate kinase [Corynebacterium ulceribovis]|uniref:guanylate kinase n=1 Tax=Corynebacterium ulceribovis TaxID=487732 RepID=UPI00035E136D|nr:guanylate kinase [Corynebacterium ulceribovis]
MTGANTVNESAASTKGQLIVLAGPSAVGKSTVVDRLRTEVPELYFSVSMTTRAPRPGEVDGHHYYFVSVDEFQRNIDNGLMLEWAEIHGGLQLSGTPASPVQSALDDGRPVLVEVDIEGARNVRQAMPDAQLVFLAPPDWDTLVERLTGRGTEAPEVIERRLQTAKNELRCTDEFNFVVINDDVDHAVDAIAALLLNKPVKEVVRDDMRDTVVLNEN